MRQTIGKMSITEKQSTVSSKKNVPTTLAVNSFKHKTPSKTLLSPHRISTQPINKNTLTTNKFEKDKEWRRLDIRQRERTNQSVLKYKEASRWSDDISVGRIKNELWIKKRIFIHGTREESWFSALRNAHLQVATRNEQMSITSQKNISSKNAEAENKNNVAHKENAISVAKRSILSWDLKRREKNLRMKQRMPRA